MHPRRRFSTPVRTMVTVLVPTVLIVVALLVAMHTNSDVTMVIAGDAVVALAALLLLRRVVRRAPVAAIDGTAFPALAKRTDYSWPVNGPRSGMADDVRQRASWPLRSSWASTARRPPR